jgi:soluble lytic murein transglycosylase-like protein
MNAQVQALELSITANGRSAAAEAGRVEQAIDRVGQRSAAASAQSASATARMAAGLAAVSGMAGQARAALSDLRAPNLAITGNAAGVMSAAGQAQTALANIGAADIALSADAAPVLSAARQAAEALGSIEPVSVTITADGSPARTAARQTAVEVRGLGGSGQQASASIAELLEHVRRLEAQAGRSAGGLNAQSEAARRFAERQQELGRVLGDIETAEERRSRQQDVLTRLLREGRLTQDQYNRALRTYDEQLRRANDSGERHRAGLMATASRLGGVATAAVAAGAAIAGSEVVQTWGEYDRLNASLKTVTGSLLATHAASELVRRFSTETPYELSQVTEAYIKLRGLGLDASERSLRSFGNTAAAMGKPIMQFIEAVADASTGEFERLKEFGIKASAEGGKVAFTFQGVTTQVKNDAESITDYLRKLGETQFASGMADQMDTVGGKLSNLKDAFGNFVDFLGDLGGRSAIKGFFGGITDFITDWQKQLNGMVGSGAQSQIDALEGQAASAVRVVEQMRNMRAGYQAHGMGWMADIVAPEAEINARMSAMIAAQRELAKLRKERDVQASGAAAKLAQGANAAQEGTAAILAAAAKKFAVPEELLKAVGMVESNLQQIDAKTGATLKSSAGALGTMQLMPDTAKGLGVDPNDMAQNIEGGAKYLQQLLTKYRGDITKTLAAYNWGAGNLDKFGLSRLPEETAKYLEKVKAQLAGSDLAGKVIDLKEYKQNLSEAQALFMAQQASQIAAAENAGKRVAGAQATALAKLDAKMADRQRQRATDLLGKTGDARRQAELNNLQAEAKDAEEYARRRAEIERQAVDQAEKTAAARLAAARAEQAQADRFEVSVAERLKLDDQVKSAETELAVLAEHRKQIEVKASTDIAAAQAKEAEARDKVRQAALQQNEAAISQAQQLASARAQNIQAQQTAGMISQSQAQGQLAELYRDSANAIAANVSELQRLAQESRDPEIVLAAEKAKAAWLDMAAGVRTPMQNLARQWQDTTAQMQEATTDWARGFAEALADLIVDGKADFRGLLDSIERDMARMTAQRATAAMMNLAGLTGAGGGMAGAAAASNAGASGLWNVASGLWNTVSGWFSSGSAAAGANANANANANYNNAVAGTSTLANGAAGAGTAAGQSGQVDYGALVSVAASVINGLIQDNTSPLIRDKNLSQTTGIIDQLADLVSNLGGWFALAKLIPIGHKLESKFAAAAYPDRKQTMVSHLTMIGSGIPLISALAMPVVKALATYRYGQDNSYNLTEARAHATSVKPVVGIGESMGGVYQGLERVMGVDLGSFDTMLKQRGARFWAEGWDNGQQFFKGEEVKFKGSKVEGQLDQFYAAVLQRQSVLKQFDDFLVKGAVRVSDTLTDISRRYTQVQKVRLFEGERSEEMAGFEKLGNKYYKLRDTITEVTDPGRKRRAEYQKLNEAYQRKFDVHTDQFTTDLDQFAGRESSTIEQSLREIDDRFRNLTARNRELATMAKKSQGRLQYQAVSDADIAAARDAAIASLRKGVTAEINGLATDSETLADKIVTLRSSFKTLRSNAEALGLGLEAIAKAEAAALEALRRSLIKPVLDQVNADANALLAQLAGPSKVIADLSAQIGARMAGLDAIWDPAAQQQSIVDISGLVYQRYQIEMAQLRDQIAAAQSLKNLVAGLKFSNLSPLTPAQRFATARDAFNADLGKYQQGDRSAEVMTRLGNEGQTYLTEARNMYASSPDYTAIFNNVTTVLDSVANSVGDGQEEVRALQKRTADVLDRLQAYLDKQIDAALAAADQIAANADQNARTVADAVISSSVEIVRSVQKSTATLK